MSRWTVKHEPYGFGEMEIGEVRYVEFINDALRFRRAAAAYRQRHPEWQYKSEMVNMDSNDTWPGVLLWRIA